MKKDPAARDGLKMQSLDFRWFSAKRAANLLAIISFANTI